MPLGRAFTGHEVASVYERGWASLTNGELLQEAEDKFDLFITTDQNLQYQQNLSGRTLAILVLLTTNWPQLRPSADQIVGEAVGMSPGEYREFKPGA